MKAYYYSLFPVKSYEGSKALNFFALVCQVGRPMEIGSHAERKKRDWRLTMTMILMILMIMKKKS